jgi:O-antigen/teichoic acid export membrane protein
MANTILSAVLGFGFWIVAARIYSADALGRDSALISSMMSLSALCGISMNNLILRLLPTRREGAGHTLREAYAFVGAATALVAGGFVVAMPHISRQFRTLSDPVVSIGYVAATVTWTLFVLQDAALTALRQALWVPLKNAVYSGLKLSALPLVAAVGLGHAVLVAWVVPLVPLLIAFHYRIFGRFIPLHAQEPATVDVDPRLIGRRNIVRFAAKDSLGATLAMATPMLLPLFVTSFLGGAANAHFYIPFTIMVTFDLLFTSVSSSLIVEGAHDVAAIPELVRSIVRRFVPVQMLGVLVLVLAAPLILIPFGAEYVREASDVLRLLALASLFRVVIALFVALARLRGRGGAILTIQALFSVLVIVLTALLADRWGIEGVAIAWLSASAIAALAALPYVIVFIRPNVRTVVAP